MCMDIRIERQVPAVQPCSIHTRICATRSELLWGSCKAEFDKLYCIVKIGGNPQNYDQVLKYPCDCPPCTPPLRVLSSKDLSFSHEIHLSHPISQRCRKLIRMIILPRSFRHTLGEMPIIQRLTFFHIYDHT